MYSSTLLNPAGAADDLKDGRKPAVPRPGMGERQGCVPCMVLRPSTAQAANKDGAPPDAADSPTLKPPAGPVKDLLGRWQKEMQGTMTCIPRRAASTRDAQNGGPGRKHSRLC